MEPMAQSLGELAGSKPGGIIRPVIGLIPKRRKVEHAPGVDGARVSLVQDGGGGESGGRGRGRGRGRGTLPDIQMRGLAQQIVEPVGMRDGLGRGFYRLQRLREAVQIGEIRAAAELDGPREEDAEWHEGRVEDSPFVLNALVTDLRVLRVKLRKENLSIRKSVIPLFGEREVLTYQFRYLSVMNMSSLLSATAAMHC